MRSLRHPEMQLLISLLGFGFAAGMLLAGRLSGNAAIALVGAIVGYWMPSPAQSEQDGQHGRDNAAGTRQEASHAA